MLPPPESGCDRFVMAVAGTEHQEHTARMSSMVLSWHNRRLLTQGRRPAHRNSRVDRAHRRHRHPA